MGRTYHGENMVKSNFYTRLDTNTNHNRISLDLLGHRTVVALECWPKSASVPLYRPLKLKVKANDFSMVIDGFCYW
jgi:hypothetical protein